MQFSTILTGLAGLALSEALTMKSVSSGFKDPRFSSSQEGKALCVNGYIPVKASGDNLKINMQEPPNGSVITQGFVDMFSTGSKFLSEVVGGPSKVSGTYNIYSQLCYPVKGINAKTIQVLTHGIGFDHTYWDVAPGYSYIDAAAEKGYTTFSYDRLGIGYSETPDSLQVVQAPLESGILYALIEMLRGGKLANTKFQNVVGVGHSFGSAVTVGVAHLWPTAMDAAVLTGFSTDMTALPVFLSALNLEIASRADHTRFASLAKDHGYLVAATITGNQFDFFHEPGYPPDNLRIAELTKGTVTLGELLTMTAVGKPATKFTGPIDVVNGEYDLPFCFGNCHLPSNLAAKVQPELFPKASKKSTTYLAKAAGHGLNLHYSATDAYAQIMSFISGNGL